jgi:hypothetical protein
LELLKPGFVQKAYGCSTSGGISHRGPMEEEEEEEEEEERRIIIRRIERDYLNGC